VLLQHLFYCIETGVFFYIYLKEQKMTEEIKITIPTSWEEITIAQFQEYNEYIKNSEEKRPLTRLIQMLSILTDTDEEILFKLNYEVIDEIKNNMVFLEDEPNAIFKNIIEIQGKKYGFQKDLHALTLGEWIDIEHYVTNGDVIQNLHYIAAIFYRKLISEGDENFDYEIDSYNNVKLENQAKFFKYNMKIADMYGTVVFFYHIVTELWDNITSCSTEMTQEQTMMKIISRVKDSEAKKKLMQWHENNQSENGIGNFYYSNLLKGVFMTTQKY